MTARRRISALVVAALGAVAVPAFAAQTIEIYTEPTTTYYAVPADEQYVPPTTYYYYTEPTTRVYDEPPIVVTPPATDDQRITEDVVDTLASDPRLSGRIGVETQDQNVELSGVVTTAGQARRAERDARSVYGVHDVQNNLGTLLRSSNPWD